MLRINLRLVLFFNYFYSFSQDQSITLDEIWNGTFSTQRMEALHSMNNGKQYSVLNFNRTNRSTSVDVYDYKTQDKIATLVDSKNLEDIPYFTNYDFSEDERKIILATDIELSIDIQHWVFFLCMIPQLKRFKNFRSKIQEPTFSPDGFVWLMDFKIIFL